MNETGNSDEGTMSRNAVIQRTAHVAAPGFRMIIDAAIEKQDSETNSGSVLGFTGCAAKSGTTTVATHASLCAAEVYGLRTLLIDANFRHPCLAQQFEIASPNGLSNCLKDLQESDLAINEVGIPNLFVMPNGNAKLKSRSNLSQRFFELATHLASEYSLVILDLPEAASQVVPVFSGGIDLLYLVGDRRQSSAHRMLTAKKRLSRKNVCLDGLFLNRHPA